MSSIEASIAGTPDESAAEKPRPSWWSAALTLGHLETRLHSTKLLDSPPEYKQALLMYAKKIADEGFRGKAEELIRELFGPVYWYALISFLFGRLANDIIFLIGDLEGMIVGILSSLGFQNVIC
jgi:hypothetical protein